MFSQTPVFLGLSSIALPTGMIPRIFLTTYIFDVPFNRNINVHIFYFNFKQRQQYDDTFSETDKQRINLYDYIIMIISLFLHKTPA